MMKKIFFILCFYLMHSTGYAQDSAARPKKITAGGYIKSMQSLRHVNQLAGNISGNLIHNRLNIKWKPSSTINFIAEFRNRLFWGEEVKQTPGFAMLLRNNNEGFNLQKSWIDNNDLVLHTNVERLYFDLKKKKWNARIGRQRINWGMTLTWNPNDIFNTYNFLDFDYEERPGSDAVKFQYLLSDFSNLEFVYSKGRKNNGIATARYFINKWNYDLQLISGIYNDHVTAGAGWAGNIRDAGFKGEIQYYFKNTDSTGNLNITTEVDYVFKKGWYLDAAILYNHYGLNESVGDWKNINFNLSPENIMPAKWNFMLSCRKEFNPLLNGNVSVVYSPGMNMLILFPGFTYSIARNLDVDLVGQFFFASINSSFTGITQQGFLRLKWSY